MPNAKRWNNPRHVRSAAATRAASALLLGERLRARTTTRGSLGTFLIELPTPASVKILALAGFDFLVLDMEHSPIDFSRLEPLVLAAHAVGIPVLVRTWGDGAGLIGKVLDIGAHGVMASHVENAERAREVVDQARYAPHGHRGFSPLARYDALEQPLHALGKSTYVVLQIEGRKALEQVGGIAAVPGVDAVFVGPYDLALSLGVPPGSAGVIDAAERIAKQVPKRVALGIYIDDPATCGAWAARGFTLQCVSFDARMLSSGARAVVEQAKRGLPRKRGGR